MQTSPGSSSPQPALRINAWTLSVILILLLAAATRFFDLGARVLSHDETNSAILAYRYSQGEGYFYDPITHGPLQFHLISLSYYLFGASDASARAPMAFAGVIAVGLVFVLQRWLGKTGAAAAALLLVFSPLMLYYARYARNEPFIVVLALLMVWAVFRYLETRSFRWLLLLTIALSLHLASKATAFIYLAQLMIFLSALLGVQLMRAAWKKPYLRYSLIAGLLLASAGALILLALLLTSSPGTPPPANQAILATVLLLLGLAALIGSALLNFGAALRQEFPALDLLIVSLTLTLPHLAALPAQIGGWDSRAFSEMSALVPTLISLGVLGAISCGLGLAWNWRRWLPLAGVFLAIHISLYSSLFTHPEGILSGFVSSLAYWLAQQEVERGGQPRYYYLLVQLPLYGYLPVLGSLAAGWIGYRRLQGARPAQRNTPSSDQPGGDQSPPADAASRASTSIEPAAETPSSRLGFEPAALLFIFLIYWAVSALGLYSFAGERMPWLTIHILWPLILLAGWWIGAFADRFAELGIGDWRSWTLLGLALLAILGAGRALGILLGDRSLLPPGANLAGAFPLLLSLLSCAGSLIIFGQLRRAWGKAASGSFFGLAFAGLLLLSSARRALRAAYVNYDYATEFLVYAHAAPGPKIALQQIEELSLRITDGKDLRVAHDNHSLYPFWWYLRDYPNRLQFGEKPSRQLLQYPVVLAGDANWARVDAILGDRYLVYEYTRMWWPMQDYYGLTWERLRSMLFSPAYREALWRIWRDRDYRAYGELVNKDFSPANWDPASKMRLYLRKDLAGMVWDAGPSPVLIELPPLQDPYAEGMLALAPELIIAPPQDPLNKPRDVAVAPDGSLYVSDSENHRILHFAADGSLLHAWGQSSAALENLAAGSFNQPWGITVAPDGTVYVADTWNHRVQRFSAEGEFIEMLGYFGNAEAPQAMWGPRDVAIDAQGRIFITDTGNKRVVVFDQQLGFLAEFGGPEEELGSLDEPVGISIGPDGLVYVADTWNGRVQVFEEAEPNRFRPLRQWTIEGWYGESLENKPYLAAGPSGQLCLSDPEGSRVLCFSGEGAFLLGWGDQGAGMSLPLGIAFDAQCRLWVADAAENRLLRFDPGLCTQP